LKPLPEKTEEMLFSRYFLQGFRLGEVTMYAPSTVEEAKRGYDSQFTGLSGFRELYLQFKAPAYSERQRRFTINTTKPQHQRLLRYPSHTAYYLTHTFSSLEECTAAQRNVREAVNFLRHFLAIDIASLRDDVASFRYLKPPSHRESPQITYTCTTNRTKHLKVGNDGWLRGNQLVEKFKDGSIGALVRLVTDQEKPSEPRSHLGSTAATDSVAPSQEWILSPQVVDSLFSGRTEGSFGLQIRKFVPDSLKPPGP
jgi:hypothetical protein